MKNHSFIFVGEGIYSPRASIENSQSDVKNAFIDIAILPLFTLSVYNL